MDKPFFRIFTAGARLLFIVLVIFVIISWFFNPVVFWIELLTTLAIFAFYVYSARTKQRDLIRYVENITYSAGTAAKSSLLSFPLPIVVIDASGELTWHNEMFAKIFDDDASPMFNRRILDVFPTLNLESIIDGSIQQPIKASFNNRHFNIYAGMPVGRKNTREILITMYLYENTEYVLLKHELMQKKSSVGIIMIDNYDEFASSQKELAVSVSLVQIDEMAENWVRSNGGVIQKYDRDKYMFVIEESFLEKAIEEKFTILETVKTRTIGASKLPVTFSIGIGRDLGTFTQKHEAAKSAIDMALGRGGDHVVIKNKNGFEFFGGKSKGVEKRTKVKSRVVATALRELINMADNVIIMGHKYSDYDSIGACIGIYRVCMNLNTPAKIVIDPQHNMVKKMLDRFRQKDGYNTAFIDPELAEEFVAPDTLVVVVDTHRDDYCEAPALVQKTEQVVVIDHHRRSERFIENATLTYHEPFASSTCEMVSEILQYLGDDGVVDQDEAEALLCGIMLDTKSFSFKTGVRTFEAAAFLRRMGADTISVKRFFASDIESFLKKNEVVAGAQMYRDEVAVVCYEDTDNGMPASKMKEVLVMAADELITIQSVKASFAIGVFDNTAHLSARSLGELNVHVILEKLGGGGHQTMAGAQLKDTSAQQAKELLLQAIDSYMDS